jgi:anti-sigma B factor antagonist
LESTSRQLPDLFFQETPVPASDSRLRVKNLAQVVQVEFLDRNILDEANIQRIGEELITLVEAKPSPKLLICFSNVDHLSSAALGALITVHKKVKDKAGQLRLSDIDPQIYEVFVITKLHKLFEIHSTAAEALASFK